MRIITCPVCDAEVPLDENDGPGAAVFCDFCKCELKLVSKKVGDREVLTAEFEEEY